jgi:hypothetical protein
MVGRNITKNATKNKRQKLQMGQSKMDNPEKLAT